MIENKSPSLCSGCTACQSSCPTHAIDMIGEKGFLYPKVDKNKCINCGLCEKKCPYLNPDIPVESEKSFLYGVQSLNECNRNNSTAGGFFSVVANYVFEMGGVVYSAVFEDNSIVHRRFESTDNIVKSFGSKYVQSNIETIFEAIKNDLKNERYVLFVGTPCQVYGLKMILSNYEKLLTIDLLCLGVSSPIIFNRYCNYLEKIYKSKINNFLFRDKSYGYSTSNPKIIFNNSKMIQQNYNSKCYLSTFFDYYNVRESCYICKFREKERVSDFTIGDFIDIGLYSKELDDDAGTSRVWVHTLKGIETFNKIKEKIRYVFIEESTHVVGGKADIINKPKRRDEFFDDFEKMDFKEFINKWEPNTFKKRMICLFRKTSKFLPFSKVIFKKIRLKQLKQFGKK